jgi:hypothetical protein
MNRQTESQYFTPFEVELGAGARHDWNVGEGVVVGSSDLESGGLKYVLFQGSPVITGLGTEAYEMGLKRFQRQSPSTTPSTGPTMYYGGEGKSLIVVHTGMTKFIRVLNTLTTVQDEGVVIEDSDFEKLREFLSKQASLVELIAAIAPKLREKFSDCEVSLELYRSRSSGESYPAFFLRREHYEKGFMASIRGFQQEFEALLSSAQGWLSVTTDFRPPRSRV